MSDPNSISTERGKRYWDGVARSYIPPSELDLPESVSLHSGWSEDIDPITYEVIRYSLMNANLEHSALLTRLCVSPTVMQARDCQTSVLTEVGDLVFLSPNLQYFSNAHSLTIKWILENRGENPGIGPDDMFLSNDVFVGAPHQSDACIAAPVFIGDELFCWVANSLHYSDVGGPVAGSFCIDATDSWQEPLNWPPIKLVSSGRLQADVIELFVRQSRVPIHVKMDIHASIAANESTKAKILKLVDRYGPEVVKGVLQRTLDAGEHLFAERLVSIPDGTWSHRAFTEAAVRGDRGIYAYQINVTKEGGKLIVDNEGTDPQVGAINVSFAALAGATLAAITQQMTSDLAGAYGGVYRLVEFRPTSGLLNCAEFPGAVSPSGATTTEMQLNAASTAICKMLAGGGEESEELILGPSIPHVYSQISNGVTADGTYFVFPNTDCLMGSLAGRPRRDGIDVGGHWWIPDGIVSNIEDFEAQMPLLCLYRRLLPMGLDGAGRFRGGLGFVEAFTAMGARGVTIDMYMGESFAKGQGLSGGMPCSRAIFRFAEGAQILDDLGEGRLAGSFEEFGGKERPLSFKGMPIDLVDGEAWEASSPSAPGYGDPLRREPDAVAADVAAQLLDVGAAERVYAVVLDGDGKVDTAATKARRQEVFTERLDGNPPGEPVEPPAGAERYGDLLFAVDGSWWCNGEDLGPITENYKLATVIRESPMRRLGPEFDFPDHEMADKVVLREFLCPRTGLVIDSEIARPEDPPLHDIRLAGVAAALGSS